MRHRALWLLLAMLTASAFVACGGGNVNTNPVGPTPIVTTVPTTHPTTDPNGNPTTAPTTAPTTVPTNTPNSTLKVSPSSLALAGVGISYQQTLTATQTTPTQLTIGGCSGVASATVGAIGTSTTITVVGTAAGSCTLTITDASGQTAVVSVAVGLPALASYCSNYASLSGVPLNVTDDSSLGSNVVLLVYITNGTSFMDNSGNFTSATANPLPAACYSNSFGSSATNRTLAVPANLTGGRIYLAYAVSTSGTVVPNPLGSANNSGPTFGYGKTPYPWDVIEYGTTSGATIDTTQVSSMGLPLELSLTSGQLPSSRERHLASALPAPCPSSNPSSIVGVTSCNFANIFSALQQDPNYSTNVMVASFNGQTIDMEIVAPQASANNTAFNWNVMGNSIPTPTPTFCPVGTLSTGYLSCVLGAYNAGTSRLFQTSGIGASGVTGDNYCVSSTDAANFTMLDVGTATSCPGTAKAGVSPNPILMPIQEFTFGYVSAPDVPGGACQTALLFGQPWGNANVGSGHVFATADAFALWKDISADLNRGTMLSTGTHPVGAGNPSMSLFFKDPMYNTYAQVVHTYFNGNLAYALAYDDLGNFESGQKFQTGNSINVRINAVPTTSASPTPNLGTYPSPSTCPALPTGIGS